MITIDAKAIERLLDATEAARNDDAHSGDVLDSLMFRLDVLVGRSYGEPNDYLTPYLEDRS